eukprot:TRINITY_DN310_c0_g1_i2.p1 TRINITY_DN310_c0_g1~~TRINITY_DN310_c0_g1_i2.p1  ORF type:complete len:1279 (-),score=344.19 TRINITY_DN310_c0_g1_i2:4-3840(-)
MLAHPIPAIAKITRKKLKTSGFSIISAGRSDDDSLSDEVLPTKFTPQAGDKFRLTMIEAQGLAAKDKNGLSDPYCVINFKKQEYQTAVIYENLNPVWDESFELKYTSSDDVIEIEVFDKDKHGKDFLGKLNIPMSLVIQSGGSFDKWFELEKRSKKSTISGSIHIACTFNVNKKKKKEKRSSKKKQRSSRKSRAESTSSKDSTKRSSRRHSKKVFAPKEGDFFFLTIVQAEDLAAKDSNGLSDPYCVVKYKSKEYKTSVIDETLNPTWNESFKLEFTDFEEVIQLDVWDKDKNGKDFLGKYEIPLSLVLDASGELDQWFELQKRSKKSTVSGRIRIQCSFFTKDEDVKFLRESSKKSGLKSSILGLSKSKKDKRKSQKMDIQTNVNITPELIDISVESDKDLPFTPKAGDTFYFTLIEAKNLAAKDSNGLSDPFCEVTYQKVDYVTSVIPKTLNPVWNETLKLKFNSFDDVIHVELFDHDKHGRDFLGTIDFHMNLLNNGRGEFDQWFELQKRSKKSTVSGHVHVQCSFMLSDDQVKLIQPKKDLSKSKAEIKLINEFMGNQSNDDRIFEPKQGDPFYLTLIEAEGLAAKDSNGLSDPFCEVEFNKIKYKTSVQPETLNPVWNESVKLLFTSFDDIIEIELFDHDDDGKDFLGRVEIPMSVLKEANGEWGDWMSLEKRSNRSHVTGRVHLVCSFFHNEDELTLLDQSVTKKKNLLRTLSKNMSIKPKGPKDQFKVVEQDFSDTSSEESYEIQKTKPKELKGDIIEVEVVEAKGLMAKDKNGLSDPFCRISLAKKKYKTEVKHETLSPKWHHTFYFEPTEAVTDEVTISVFDYDSDGSTDFLGIVKIPETEILGNMDVKDVWLELQKRSARSKVSGQIHVKYRFVPAIPDKTEDEVMGLLGLDVTDPLCLNATIIEAKGLLGKNKNGSSNPYCSIDYNQQTQTTQVMGQTLSPFWNQDFQFDYETGESFHLNVFDKEDDKDKFLGMLKIDFQELLNSTGILEDWFELQQRSEKSHVSGSIKLRLCIAAPPVKEEPEPEDPIILVESEETYDEDLQFSEYNLIDISLAKKSNHEFKIVFIGESGVGKTNILSSWMSGVPIDSSPTIGPELFTKAYKIDDDIIKVNCWDTAGQEKFHAMTLQYYRGAVGAVIVYDVTNEKSFDAVQKWINDIKSETGDDVIILLIGNKSDLEERRAVGTQKAIRFASDNDLHFLETSAVNGKNIKKAFKIILQDIYEKEKLFTPRNQDTITNRTTVPNAQTIRLNTEETKPEPKKNDCICG